MPCCFRPVAAPIAMLGIVVALAAAVGSAAPDDQKAKWGGDVYTLDTCIVSHEKLGSMGEPVVKSYDGREVRFCCEPCVAKFDASKDKFFKQIDEQLIEQQMPHYPMDVCLVMPDDKLEGGHEESVKMIYRNRLVRFCCTDCVKEFKDSPDQYVAKLNAAVIKQQKHAYPLETCVISGEKLGGMGEPVDYVVGTTLIRFCCDSCVKKFEKNPQPTLAKLHEAWKAKHADGHGEQPAAKPADKPAHPDH